MKVKRKRRITMKKVISFALSVILTLLTVQTALPAFAAEGENPLKEMRFSQSEVTLNNDGFGENSADLMSLLVLIGEKEDEKATYDELEWRSSKPSVADVDENGLVTAVGNGECTVTVTQIINTEGSSDYGVSASCKITVRDSIKKFYNAIETTKSNLPSDYTNKEKYLPAAVDALEAALAAIEETGELEDTAENCQTAAKLSEDLTKAYADLINSVLVLPDDIDFYEKWNEAYAAIPEDFWTEGVYEETSAQEVKDIINKVASPETPWLKNASDKAKIDALAEEFTARLANLKRHTQSISLNYTNATRYVGGSIKLTADTHGGDDDIIWTADNNYAVKIEGSGKTVTVNVVGGCDDPMNPYVTITATSNGKSAICRIMVDNYFEDIKLITSERKTVYQDNYEQIEYEFVGVDPTKPVTGSNAILFTSSDPNIAEVDKSTGLIYPKAEGDCVITLVCGSVTKQIKLHVIKAQPVQKFVPVDIPTAVTVNTTTVARVMIYPTNASSKDVEWFSADESIATVTSLGTDASATAAANIKGLKAGSVKITYRSTDGNYLEGSFTITVNPLISSISLNKSKALVYVGDDDNSTFKLSANILPAHAGNQVLTWISSDESVATVTGGLVRIQSVGTCEITAYTTDGTGLSASCKLTVVGDTQNMTINKTSGKLKVGQKLQLTCDVETKEADYKVDTWKSSNEKVAAVDSKGLVTAKYPGTAVIKAIALDGTEEECTVTVTADLKGIKLPSSMTLAIGKEKTVTVTYDPSYATNKKVTWRSSDTGVARIDANGKIYAAGTGTATITAVSQEGGFIATCKVTVVRPVTSVTISKVSYTLTIGSKESVKLTSSVKPDNATLKTVRWTSSNQKVAKVSSTGIVTAVGPGTAYISVITNDGGYKDTCKITVIQPLKGLKFKNSKETFYVGKEASLAMVYSPANASNKSCSWKSSNKKVATVNSKGVVTAVATGTCTITAKSNDGGYTVKCKLTVIKKVYPKSVDLNYSKATIEAGKTLQLKSGVHPGNSSIKSVKWSSSDSDIATVNSKGLVTAKKGGTVTITCTTKSAGKKASCKITVKQRVTGMTLSATAMTLVSGRSKTLTATVSPASATNKNIKWYSGNKSVAKVDKSGRVTAVKAGTVYITAKSKDNSKILKRCKVTVIQAPTKITLNLDEATMRRGSKMTLTSKVGPSNSYDKTVTWSSNKTSVARVSKTGVVTAVSAGKATITCRSNTNDKVTAVCVVTVEEPVRSIALSVNRMTLTTGKTKTLSYTITPSYATNKKVTYKSSDKDVVTVSKKGVIEAVGPGTATVTVRTNDGYFVDKCKITVIEPVIRIDLNKTNMTLDIAESKTLKATIKPKNATNKDVTWRSSNSMVARVSQSGKVTALKPGTVTITCISDDGVKATCKVTCVIGVESVELNKSSLTLKKGAKKTLRATIEPTNATIKDVKWYSSDKSIATVDKNGRVTAVKKGTAVITCKTKQGGYKTTCVVKVTK